MKCLFSKQVGSGEVFSFDDPVTNDDDYEEDEDWQDLVRNKLERLAPHPQILDKA